VCDLGREKVWKSFAKDEREIWGSILYYRAGEHARKNHARQGIVRGKEEFRGEERRSCQGVGAKKKLEDEA